MADHPFHGKWRSQVLRKNHTVHEDGEFHLTITPAGIFTKGDHNGTNLKCTNISNNSITLEEEAGDKGTFTGEVFQGTGKKILVGEAKFPDPLDRKNALGQNDGVW